MNTTTTTRKARTPRKAATPKAPEVEEKQGPKATTKPVEAAPEPQPEPEPETAPEEDAEPDYTYLADKDPSELHKRMAAWLTERTGVEISPKHAQVVMSMRQAFRTSETGREIVEGRHAAAEARKAEKLAAKKASAAKKMAELQAILDAK